MTWNYRLVRTKVDGIECFSIHEAYYNKPDDIVPQSLTEEPVAFTGDTINDVLWSLERALEGARKPVLEFVDGKVREYME